MLDGGADPRYIGRRLLRMASEDVGNADPRALQLTESALATYERLGSPEGELALAQAVLYMASVPKSDAAYAAFKEAMAFVRQTPSYDVPMHLRNAPTHLMQRWVMVRDIDMRITKRCAISAPMPREKITFLMNCSHRRSIILPPLGWRAKSAVG